ncbi:MAG: protein-disulfide reductase DsbD [Gammaproteobacteria bacterium]|nr:protein-disulfide reductase DsbD [Gammaproteobacteria bacterium]
MTYFCFGKKYLTALLFALLALPGAWANSLLTNDDQPLDPDIAFQLSTRVVDANTVEASWVVAKGYYLYRDKFEFGVIDGGVSLKPAVYPKGEIKQDPLFGQVETYTDKVTITLPLSRSKAEAHLVTLRIGYQGCNEPIGVCYNPVKKEAVLNLPAGNIDAGNNVSDPTAAATLSSSDGIPSNQVEFLKPDEAFKVAALASGETGLRLNFDIAEGYYLYRDKFRFVLDNGGNKTELNSIELPAGKIKDDPSFGKTEIYPHSFSLTTSFTNDQLSASPVLRVHYQGCKDKGICYLPTVKKFQLRLDGNKLLVEPFGQADAPVSGDSPIGMKEGYLAAIFGAFIVGLLLSFTPCVLPMIPILSSVIIGQSDREFNKTRGGLLAASYVLGTAFTYSIAGYVAGSTGEQLQAYFQNVWAISIMSGLFVLLALSMFGFYELQIPSGIQTRLHMHSDRFKNGSFIGIFFLGAISALIVGACVSPLLISALSIAIASKDPILGTLIMFAMAWGMGLILIVVGIGAGALVPKAGGWMERVKHFFGVMLLGVAIYLLGTLPQVPVLLLWGLLLIITAMYFGALEQVPQGSSGWRYFYKGIGIVMITWGVMALFGGVLGNRDILRPIPEQLLQAGTMSSVEAHATPLFNNVDSLEQIQQLMDSARTDGKPVLVDFYASWCTDCVRMEKTTFMDAGIRQGMQRFVRLKVDLEDANDPDSKKIKKHFGIFGPPAMLFFDSKGEARKNINFYGYKTVNELLVILDKVN